MVFLGTSLLVLTWWKRRKRRRRGEIVGHDRVRGITDGLTTLVGCLFVAAVGVRVLFVVVWIVKRMWGGRRWRRGHDAL